ncbi:MAG: hypothetical protein R3E77_00440 [Steroidobacteraceae bacterium]
MGRKVSIPPALAETLAHLFGESVSDVEVIEYSYIARCHPRMVATTRPGRIYLRGSAEDFFGDLPLVLHEFFHVVRQWRPGHMTVWRYLLESFRRGYEDNRFEVEAREFSTDEHYRCRALLARHASRLDGGHKA